jgi:chromosome segregation ATPase
LEDGRGATDDDPPLSRWWKIEFTRTHAFDVDSPEQRGALDGGFFDGSGRAVDARLQRGEDGKVEFKKGDQILVKEEAAIQLIDQGVAELRDKVYLRPLIDYRNALRRIRLRLSERANRSEELDFATKVLEEAISKTEGMLVANQAIKLKLEQDLSQFRVEKNAITAYTEQLREQVATMRAEMARLYQENLILEQQIEEKQLTIERSLDTFTSIR